MGSIQGDSPDVINVQVYAPDHNIQKCLPVVLEETVWTAKQKFLSGMPKDLEEGFNYGLFLPPCNGRAGKFLLEERTFRDYPFQDCVPYLELKYKKRVYKMLNLDERTLKQLHSKSNLKKFMEHVSKHQTDKVDKMVKQGLDPNFHDPQGETPLTYAASMSKAKDLTLTLVSGGAHLDFRNLEGQTPLHKAAFNSSQENVKTLLELGASPNYKDPLGLTPLYYCMLQTESSADAAELFLRDYADLGVCDPHGNQEIHQACKNGLVQHLEHLLYYGTDINAQNVNGNSPLHVCAVNNRENCARVLLFRGAESELLNKQGQSAYHVALICGNAGVAEVIKNHDPNEAVPYRGMPRYNSKRRLTWSTRNLSRARSFSQSSDYGTLPFGGGSSRSLSRVSSVDPCTSGQTSPVPSIASNSTITGPHASREPHNVSTENRSAILRSMRKSNSETTDLRPQNGPPPGVNYQQPMGVPRQHHGYPNGVPGNYTVGPHNGVKTRSNSMAGGHGGHGQLNGHGGPKEPVYGATQGSGTLKRIPADSVHNQSPVVLSADVNIPRILVIPRGPKGFGFILRGAKKMEPGVCFEPTPSIPALQFFEGVDMNGMAMKAGLKPGDFLLEINGVDVRCASHDQVVRLIQQSGETISLKVITIDPATVNQSFYGTLPGRRRSIQGPAPPQRHPNTSLSLSVNRGKQYAYGLQKLEEESSATVRRQLYPAKSMEFLPTGYKDPSSLHGHAQVQYREEKIASVRGRGNSRRISAAELEQLMARQNSSEMDTSADSIPGTPGSVRPGPRVYASVADMKKRAKQGKIVPSMPPVPPGLPRIPPGSETPTLKSFHSSPDLQKFQEPHHHDRNGSISSELALARDIVPQGSSGGGYSAMTNRYWRQSQTLEDSGSSPDRTPTIAMPPSASAQDFRRVRSVEVSGTGNYGTPRPLLRPKTPPPPPPPMNQRNSTNQRAPSDFSGNQRPPASIPPPPPCLAPPPPPPAPPPPPEMLRQTTPLKSESTSRPPAATKTPPSKGDCRGITAEALCAVKLNKTPSPDQRKTDAWGSRNAQSNPVAGSNSTKGTTTPSPGGGITAEAINSVRLKSTSAASGGPTALRPKFYLDKSGGGANSSSQSLKEGLAQRKAAMGEEIDENLVKGASGKVALPTPQKDFDSDLRAALARRRNQVSDGKNEANSISGNTPGGSKLTPQTAETEKNGATTVFKGDGSKNEGLGKKDKPLPPVPPSGTNNGRVGLSLKESVQKSYVGSGNHAPSGNQHSPPMTTNGFSGIKKDSGYTSSRNSLEPSECGDESSTNQPSDDVIDTIPDSPDFPPPPPPEFLNAQLNGGPTQEDSSRNRVSMLSQQLEDSCGGIPPVKSGMQVPPRPPPPPPSTKPVYGNGTNRFTMDGDRQDAMSVASTLSTLSGCSEAPSYASSAGSRAANQHSPLGHVIREEEPSLPPPDYEEADSGTGDSDADDNLTPGAEQRPFGEKKLPLWSINDVMDWLDSLHLSEYKRAFSRNGMNGNKLMNCDRAQFTKLGVTRIAHRISMENSLKSYKPTNTTAF